LPKWIQSNQNGYCRGHKSSRAQKFFSRQNPFGWQLEKAALRPLQACARPTKLQSYKAQKHKATE
jgi:hypothetical protein